VGTVNLALWGLGVVLIAVGYQRARGPYARYQALRQQDANVERYERWRGGTRDTSPTGASVAMQMLLRQARIGGLIAIAGFVCVLAGFAIR
jgi:hypothetical protein